MNFADLRAFRVSALIAACCLMVCAAGVYAQEAAEFEPSVEVEPVVVPDEGPRAAFEFEKSFRDQNNSDPVHLQRCENITELTPELWSKKHVLTDFKKRRTADQVGVIVIVKTEYCCNGSRLCAVTTACLEKKSTPLVGRFRVYAGWIKNHPDHPRRRAWDEEVIDEYDFIQGPGARVVVMVPTWDGKMYQWHSTATKLELDGSIFESRQGETPELDRFLQTAIDYAPATRPSLEQPAS